MIDRINVILKSKNITSSQLAEKIGIQPSGMSHILKGRNNPSLDFVKKVLTAYPEISPDWLLFGNGEMLRASESPKVPENKVIEKNVEEKNVENQTVANQQMDIFAQNQADKASEVPVQSQEQLDLPVLNIAENEVVANSVETQVVENELVEKNAEPAEISMKETVSDSDTKNSNLEKKVERFLVLFSDHTFTEYTRNSD